MQNSKTYMKQMQCNILLKARYNSVEIAWTEPNRHKKSFQRL